MKVFSAIAIAAMVAVTAVQAAILDSIRFGDRSSERSHGFAGPQTRVVETGDPAETARELLPLEPVSWQGGNMRFKMRVDPRRPNYVTVKLRGDDVNENMLILYVDGRQVGFRHFGDVDILDHGSASAAVPGRFYYVTVPIPMSVTYRKSRVEFEIAATGGIVADGADFEHYQKEMRTPSRRIYDFYVHDDGFFEPPAGERQGRPPEPVPPESGSGDELEAFKAAVNHRLAFRRSCGPPRMRTGPRGRRRSGIRRSRRIFWRESTLWRCVRPWIPPLCATRFRDPSPNGALSVRRGRRSACCGRSLNRVSMSVSSWRTGALSPGGRCGRRCSSPG